MALTREFKETVKARISQDSDFRSAMLAEAIELLLSGDVATGRRMLRDYINATVGFEELSLSVKKPTKSVMRMFGPSGNPTADNLFQIINHLQIATGVQIGVNGA